MEKIQIIEKLCLGMMAMQSGELNPVLVRVNGEPIIFSGTGQPGVFIPFPPESYEVSAVLPNGVPTPIGYRIPGNPKIDWDELAQKAEQERQDKRTKDHQAKQAKV